MHLDQGIPAAADAEPTNLPGRATGILAALLVYFGGLAVVSATNAPHWLALILVLTAASSVWLALAPRSPFANIRCSKRIEWALVVLTAVLAAWFALPSLVDPVVRSDQAPSLDCAARSILQLTNPWDDTEVACMASLSITTPYMTPLRTGPFAHQSYPADSQIIAVEQADLALHTSAGFPRYGYPPLAATWILPVARAGLRYQSWYVDGATLLLLALMWRRHVRKSPLLASVQLLTLAIFIYGFNGDAEVLGYTALIASYLELDHGRTSSIWMAIAILSNPLCWVALPGWVLVWARDPARTVRTVWFLASTLVLLLPWFLLDHSLVTDTWRFVTLPEFPIGFSVAAMTHYPYPPPLLFFSLFAGAIATISWVAWHFARVRWAMASVVWVAFLVAWRGNAYYFLPLFWLSPSILVGWRAMSETPAPRPPSRHEPLAPTPAGSR